MTALKEYERLESTALWRESVDAQRRDVIVSLGDLTLNIINTQGRILAHWSLVALCRKNPGRKPAIYYPRGNPGETLEIDQGAMIDAITTLQNDLRRATPRPGRLRKLALISAALVIVSFLIFGLPQLIRSHALRVVPTATIEETGDRLLSNIQKSTGEVCDSKDGNKALESLVQRINDSDKTRLRLIVVSEGVHTTLMLPGGITLINRRLIEEQDSPDVLAGYLLAEIVAAQEKSPMQRLIEKTALNSAVRLLSTGSLSDTLLDQYAHELLADGSDALPTADGLRSAFHTKAIPFEPYFAALGTDAPAAYHQIEQPAVTEPVISDSSWLRLQAICDA